MKDHTNGKKQFDNKGFLARKKSSSIGKYNKNFSIQVTLKTNSKSQTVENYDLRKFKFDPSEVKVKEEVLISSNRNCISINLRDLQKYCNKKYEIFFCGGGTKNNYLMDRFKELNIENLQFFKTSV